MNTSICNMKKSFAFLECECSIWWSHSEDSAATSCSCSNPIKIMLSVVGEPHGTIANIARDDILIMDFHFDSALFSSVTATDARC